MTLLGQHPAVGVRPAGPRRRSRLAWHVSTGAVVVGWLLALVVVVLAHPFVPVSRWLMVHLLGLGAASNAILIWSWHFTVALLRLSDDVRPGQVRRLALFNAGALAVVGGMVSTAWPLVLVGGTAVSVAVLWHAAALLRALRQALPSRFGATVRYYGAAGALLPVGIGLGVAMARAGTSGTTHARLVVAHAAVNLLGWIGLTVLGTLVTLWPTMLRTRIAGGSEPAARRALPMLVGGVVVTAAGALGGARMVTAGGLVLYVGALLALLLSHREEVRRKPPADFATLSVLAGALWLTGSLGALVVGIASADGWAVAADRAEALTAPLIAGFVAQVLLGALSYLVPVVLGGGPAVVRATGALLDRAGHARVAATNAGLLVCVVPVPSLVRVLCSLVVFLALASFLPLLVRAVLTARRMRTRPPAAAGPRQPPSLRARSGSTAAGLAVVLLAVGGGVALDPSALARSSPSAAAGVTATGRTTTVEIRVEGMRFVPDAVEVPAGDRLVVLLLNGGSDVHDLVLDSGARTSRLSPGQRAELDVGIVGRDLEGWCSVAGHRQMGMRLQVTAAAATGPRAGHGPTGGDASTAASDVDLAAQPPPGFVAWDATLPPASQETTHQVTLEVREVVREVAPGVRQKRWTFAGTAPGPTLRGKVGDVFEVTVVNDGSIGHSIDFHAGALAPERPMRTIAPGESLVYRFTAARSGIWMYHCSTSPMSMHLANGMFGAVVIDPPDLAPVDREFLLVQSEAYLGPHGGVADAARIATGTPDLVTFNGYAGQYDSAPLQARAGERTRIWVLAAGPNAGSAFHVVGGQFDTVYREGAYDLRGRDTGGSQVLGLSPGQGGFVELVFPEAGDYPFVTHVMRDAERGAHGVVRVAER